MSTSRLDLRRVDLIFDLIFDESKSNSTSRLDNSNFGADITSYLNYAFPDDRHLRVQSTRSIVTLSRKFSDAHSETFVYKL